MSQPPPAAMGRASGNIGAMKALTPLWFFRSSGVCQNKIPAATPIEEGYCPFGLCHSAVAPTLYMEGSEFICNLNDMRSKHGSPDWRCGPGFRGRNHRRQDQVP